MYISNDLILHSLSCLVLSLIVRWAN